MSSANAQALSIRCVETSMSQGLHVVEKTASLCLCVCVCVYIGLGLANVRGGEQTRCTIGVRNVGPAGRIY